MEKLIYEGPEGEILLEESPTGNIFTVITAKSMCPMLFDNFDEAVAYLEQEAQEPDPLPGKFSLEYLDLHGEDIGGVKEVSGKFLAVCNTTLSIMTFETREEGKEWIAYNCWAAKLENDEVVDPVFYETETVKTCKPVPKLPSQLSLFDASKFEVL